MSGDLGILIPVLITLFLGIIFLAILYFTSTRRTKVSRQNRITTCFRRYANMLKTIWVLLRLNPLERLSATIYICALVLLTVLHLTGFIGLSSLLGSTTTLTIAIVLILARLYQSSTETSIMSFISQYLIKGDISLIDQLLGKLISGKWEIAEFSGTQGFFSTLQDLAAQGDYEMRRRITEALPALFRWRLESTTKIAEILRKDLDDRWRSDIRRRVVEALPYLLKENPDAAESLLHWHEKDEFFTAIAIAEVGHDWLRIDKKKAEPFLSSFLTTVEKYYSREEHQAITMLLDLLELIRRNRYEACQKMKSLSKSENLFLRVAIARNIPRVIDTCPETCFGLIEYFLRKQEHKYVRRPIAKEKNTKAILNALRNPQFKERAESVLWKLVKDPDDIIRVTTFDLIDDLEKISPQLSRQIVDYVIANENNKDLLRRAKAIQEDVGRST